jgi:hypothetical protein
MFRLSEERWTTAARCEHFWRDPNLTFGTRVQSLDRNGHVLSLTPMQYFGYRIDQPRVAEYGWIVFGKIDRDA